MTLPRDTYDPATDANSPAYQSLSYAEMMRDVVIVNDCYVGTSAVTAAGSTYLRQFSAESTQDFNARLNSSKFWNAFRRTVHGLVGLIFRKNPVVQADVPSQIQSHLEDVDLQGAHLDVFLKERCLKGMIDGHCFILVDMPKPVIASKDASGVPTSADSQVANRRPYWVPVNKDQVLNYRTEKRNGAMVLTQVTIWERILEENGKFGETLIDQYRVLEPGKWTVYRYNEESQGSEGWEIYAEGETSLDYIPLVPFYALQTGYFESTPPLLDVAHENLRHYNLQSSLDRVLDLCNMPGLLLKGRTNPDDPIVFGRVIDVPTDGDGKYLEPTGVAIESTQNEIDRCKANIASLGLLLLSSAPKVTKTATETTVEYTAETAELGAIARNLQDCAERCLIIEADYLGIDWSVTDDGAITINREFVRPGLDPQAWQRLQDDVANNRITLETYWLILEGKAEILPESFDATEERAAVDAEKDANASLTNRMVNQFTRGLDTGTPTNSPMM
jgi:hypothetical protein